MSRWQKRLLGCILGSLCWFPRYLSLFKDSLYRSGCSLNMASRDVVLFIVNKGNLHTILFLLMMSFPCSFSFILPMMRIFSCADLLPHSRIVALAPFSIKEPEDFSQVNAIRELFEFVLQASNRHNDLNSTCPTRTLEHRVEYFGEFDPVRVNGTQSYF